MRKIVALLSLLLLVITVNAQPPRHHGRHFSGHRTVYFTPHRQIPCYEEIVVLTQRERPKKEVIVVNNYIEREKVRTVENEDEYLSLDCNQPIREDIDNVSFDYSDMWSQTIWFKEDSYKKIRTDGQIALHNVAKFLSEHSDATVVLYGYASRRHGTYGYNMKLASNRVKNVKSYLSNLYEVDWSRIKCCVIGTSAQEYDTDMWNQCVVIKCER